MKTNKQITYNALDGSFTDYHGKVNTDYLLDSISMIIDNDSELYHAVVDNHKRKIHAIVWSAFYKLTDELIKNEELPQKHEYYPSSDQLKKWLTERANGLQTFATLIDAYETERKEYIEKYGKGDK